MHFLSHTRVWCLRPEVRQKGGVTEGVLLSAVGPQHAELLIISTCKSSDAALQFSSSCGCCFSKMQGKLATPTCLGHRGPGPPDHHSPSPQSLLQSGCICDILPYLPCSDGRSVQSRQGTRSQLSARTQVPLGPEHGPVSLVLSGCLVDAEQY